MTATVEANGVTLGVEHFGDASAPLVLCAGGTTMLSWPEAVCERLAELAMPTLVAHGRRSPFFPVGNGEALAHEIPGARLLALEQASTAIPAGTAEEVATAMLEL